jgi:hypothetical protein
VREPVPVPLCGFYAAVLTRLFLLFDLYGRAEVVACRGTGGATCVLRVALFEDDSPSAQDTSDPSVSRTT